jgi:hypothetical protein
LHGQGIMETFAESLGTGFSNGLERADLWQMRDFYVAYPNRDALRRELSWTQFRLLLRVDKAEARAFHDFEAVNARWFTRELERQFYSLLFERQAVSGKDAGPQRLQLAVNEDLVRSSTHLGLIQER